MQAMICREPATTMTCQNKATSEKISFTVITLPRHCILYGYYTIIYIYNIWEAEEGGRIILDQSEIECGTMYERLDQFSAHETLCNIRQDCRVVHMDWIDIIRK